MSDNSKIIKQSILIVDDTPSNIHVIANILKKHYSILIATSGKDAFNVIAKSKVDLILLDIMMPEMDGYKVCQELQQNPETADIPVIFISAKTEESDEITGFEVGAVDYVSKPVKASVLLARVNTHLRLRQMQKELQQQNQALAEATRLRDDVERITRHDLKTPLNSIIGVPSLLIEEYDFSPIDFELLMNVERAGRTMLNMINRSLDLYKMEVGTYHLVAKPLNLLSLLHIILKEIRTLPSAENKTYTIQQYGQPANETDEFWILAEEMLCYPMFSNLILNAFEAAPDNSIIEIQLENSEHKAKIHIINEGVVPASIQNKFFNKYITAGKKTGTGLGTYSAKLCAKTQNGTIQLVLLENKRTQITVTLPIAMKN